MKNLYSIKRTILILISIVAFNATIGFDGATLAAQTKVKATLSGSTLTVQSDNSGTDFRTAVSNATSNKKSKVTTVIINSDITTGTDMSDVFKDMTNLTTISGLDKLNVSNTTNLKEMFRNCSSLRTLDLSAWNVSRVTSYNRMFYDCKSLSELNLSNWNTAADINYKTAVFNNTNLSKVVISGNIKSVIVAQIRPNLMSSTEKYGWKKGSTEYQTIPISNGKGQSGTYYSCYYATRVKTSFSNGTLTISEDANGKTIKSAITGFGNKGGVTRLVFNSRADNKKYYIDKDLSLLFASYTNMQTTSGFEKIDVSEVEQFTQMFEGCIKLTSLDLSSWDVSKVWKFSKMFKSCESMTSLNINNWNTESATDMGYFFYGCKSLTSLNVNHLKTGKVTFFDNMFRFCEKLTTVNLSNWDTGSCINMAEMFHGCIGMKTLDLRKFNTSKVRENFLMFYNCQSLTDLKISGWKTDALFRSGGVFQDCHSLPSVDVSSWNTSNVTEGMGGMFENCYSMTNVNVKNWNLSKASDLSTMFKNCRSLASIDLSTWNTANINNMKETFSGCTKLKTLNISSWNSSKVTNYSSTFANTDLATVLVGSNLTSNVSNQIRPLGITGNIHYEWKRDSDQKRSDLIPLSSNKSVAGTYRAVLKIYTITFNSNGATSGAMAKQQMTATVAGKLKANTLGRLMYNYKGWSKQSGATVPTFSNQQSMTLTGNITLYPVWEEKHLHVQTDNIKGITNDDYKTITVDGDGYLDVNIYAITDTLNIESGIDTYFNITEDSELHAKTVKFKKVVDDNMWYFFSCPFNISISDVIAANKHLGTYGTHWLFKEYSEERRAAGNYDGANSRNWVVVPASETIEANKGYLVGVTGSHLQKVVFPKYLSSHVTVDDNVLSTTINVKASTSGHPVHVGWNLISVPVLSKGSYEISFTSEDGTIESSDLVVSTPNNHGVNGYNQDLRSMYAAFRPTEAFFVQVPKSGKISFVEKGLDIMKSEKASNNYYTVEITDTAGYTTDKAVLRHRAESTVDVYDVMYDVQKMTPYNTARVYFPDHDINLSFSSINPDDYTQVNIGVYTPSAGSYTIRLDQNEEADYQYAIYDAELDIEVSGDYTFQTSGKGHNSSRFFLRKVAKIVTGDEGVDVADECMIYNVDGGLVVENVEIGTLVMVYDEAGRLVQSDEATGEQFTINGLANGIYMVKIGNSAASKIVVR